MGATKSDTAALHASEQLVEPTCPTAADVLSGVVAGERWAHSALYDTLYPVVARTLQKVLQDTSGDYEDLVQACFERIVQTLVGAGAKRVVNLSAWGGAIAAHVALDALRSRIRERKLFERPVLGSSRIESVPAPNVERQLEARHQLLWLQDALARMNQDQANTVVLHDLLGHDLVEVASIMNVSVAAAQRRLSRGHKELLRRAKASGRCA